MLSIRSVLSDFGHAATTTTPFFTRRVLFNAPMKCHYRTTSWQPWEDQMLIDFVKHNGNKWAECVRHCLPHRTPGHCQLRWVDCLDPNLRKGPLSSHELELLRKGVAEHGEGHWKMVREQYLPNRSARMLKSTWESVANPRLARKGDIAGDGGLKHQLRQRQQPWTPEDDALVLKGYAELGGPKWKQIADLYLPSRPPTTIASHYRAKLEPGVRNTPWTEEERDLLLRRVILYGQEWKTVAEGIPGRTPTACRTVWSEKVDPSLKPPGNRAWSYEETETFWRRLYAHEGDWVKVRAALPGRSRLMLQRKFNEDLKTLRVVIGDDIIGIRPDETRIEWRTRLAGHICEWLEKYTNVDTNAAGALVISEVVDSAWTNDDLEILRDATADIQHVDWSAVAERLGKSVGQCKYQYQKQLASNQKARWTKELDDELRKLVDMHGDSNWSTVAEAIPSNSNITPEGCKGRWETLLEAQNRVRGRFTAQENALLLEGVSMFGKNWVAIAKTYLPRRAPWQCEAHWRTTTPRKLGSWSKEEDEALRFAVEQYGESAWQKVASLVANRTTAQCRERYQQYLAIEDRKTGKWSFDERIRLMEIVNREKQKGNPINWKGVADQLGTGRTKWSCRSKHRSMVKTGNESGLRTRR